MLRYEALSEELTKRVEDAMIKGTMPDLACSNSSAIRRRDIERDVASVWRPPFVHDIDKIMHCPYYNRYTDKTQVFSLWRNDDITRRSLHVQLVSRIARTIGTVLGLNLDLIEAIALGHDMGHPPFAHTGEIYLDELSFKYTGRHFYHNIQSVRVLDSIFPYNISLQTLNGIAAHNGEIEREEYYPEPMDSFDEFDKLIERCYTDPSAMLHMHPSTLEGCVVRLADIIAYVGKDRQDAARTNIADQNMFCNEAIGSINSEIINNLVVNVMENSYGKPCIKLDKEHFDALSRAKKENYAMIYNRAAGVMRLDKTIKPMMEQIYGQCLDDLKSNNQRSPIFTHHIKYVNTMFRKTREVPYEMTDPDQIVIDYIASMTDDYFIELHKFLFPQSDLCVEYRGYFDEETEL